MDRDLRLVGALFEQLDAPDWASAFLAGVCAETRSPAAAVLHVDVATRRQTLPAYFGQGAAMALAFEQTHASGNPWRPADESQGPPAGSVVVPDDLLPLASLRRTAFWADFLRPMDVDHGGGVIGLRDAQQVISLTLLRSARVGPYNARERAWLGRIAPHWVNACRLRRRLPSMHQERSDTVDILDGLDTAAFLLDGNGYCIRWNAAADELLRQGRHVRLHANRLVAPCHDGAQLLLRTGVAVLRHPGGDVAGHATTHTLPGHGPLGSTRAVVFIDTIETAAPERLQRSLRAVYGLTAREAELAVRLADGADVAEASETMVITSGAARTRLKSIYGKTGVRHQGGLVGLVRSMRVVVGRSSVCSK